MNGEKYLLEAKILFASGFPEKSIEYFNKALEHGQDAGTVCLSRSAVQLTRGKYKEAAEDASCVLDADPENERGYYFRGIAHFGLGQYREAIADLTKCLTKNHERGIAYLARGLAYAEIGAEEDAALDFSTASNFSSAEVDAFFKLFGDHKEQLNKTMDMLKRTSAPWKAMLTVQEADKIRSWLS